LPLTAFSMMLALAQPVTHLTVQPWTGKDLTTTTSAAAKYRLLVEGKPNATVELEATEVANGWIAAFCTTTVCAPQRVQVTIPASGQAVYQFELIRESDSAAASSGATITGGDASVKVPPAHR
jgi:hypothetical protein